MRKTTQKLLGQEGENQAVAFLLEKGYAILHRNYRYKHAEIDIIAQKENVLAFVEVKMRSSEAFGTPESFVTKLKELKMKQAAQYYLDSENPLNIILRFDVISISKKAENQYEIWHLEDVFC